MLEDGPESSVEQAPSSRKAAARPTLMRGLALAAQVFRRVVFMRTPPLI
jgi:hypothetical protein